MIDSTCFSKDDHVINADAQNDTVHAHSDYGEVRGHPVLPFSLSLPIMELDAGTVSPLTGVLSLKSLW